jgi:hypothetical protein
MPAEFDNPEFKVLDETPKAKIGVIIYFGLILTGFYLLAISRSDGVLLSPWQTIKPAYIIIFFFATLILGLLIFSKLRAKTLLFLFFAHSLLLHSYLPLTHQLIYGADQWRLMAVEQQLIQGKPLSITSFNADPANFIQALDPGKLAYSQQWGAETILSRLFNLSPLSINKWSLPIIWSIIFPLLLFELGRALGWDKKQSLLFVWLGFLPFAWQAGGSFALPVNYGFICWLLMVLLLLKRIKQQRWEQIVILVLMFVLSVFGYTLYFLLFGLAWVLMEIMRSWKGIFSPIGMAGMTIIIFLFIPAIEIISHYSYFSLVNFATQIKQFIGNTVGFYLAFGPRPHDILGGNMIFNQTPSYAFVANIFTQWKFWIPVFMFPLIIIAIFGIVKLSKEKKIIYSWLAIMTTGLWSGYFIGFYLFLGDHIISRRLDNILTLFLMSVFVVGLNEILKRYFIRIVWKGFVILLLSIAITASYSLGPDTKTISVSEYNAMQYVWSEVKNEKNPCVIADTYPLLALEYFSAKTIVGGGLPISGDFSQTKREELFSKLSNNKDDMVTWSEAKKITGASKCWFFLEGNIVSN